MELYLNLTNSPNSPKSTNLTNSTFIELGNKLYSSAINNIELVEITMNEYYWLQENITKLI